MTTSTGWMSSSRPYFSSSLRCLVRPAFEGCLQFGRAIRKTNGHAIRMTPAIFATIAVVTLGGFSVSFPALAQVSNPAPEAPPDLNSLQNLKYSPSVALYGDDDENMQYEKLEIRLHALREAAMSLGARAGLASRTWEIRQTLDERERYMDQVFDFRQLLITAPSGLLIEPPIVYEAMDTLNIEDEGQTAAVADRIFNINKRARIVTTPRNWRSYLERDWGKVQFPPAILYPKDDKERKEWNRLVQEGWDEGRRQADEIFQADLNRLTAEFNGMVQYRMLLTQGIISPPFALEVDRGVTGGGDEMRVGDRAVQITGPSQLQPDAFEWKPADR